jgi:acetyl esterase/lipase
MTHTLTRNTTLTAIILFFALCTGASAAEPVPLWPGDRAPGDKGDIGAEFDKTPDDKITRISNVSRPTITLFPAAGDSAKPRPAVLVCPGGGYNILAWNHEGTDICEWLNSIGVHAVLLKYRVPRREGREKHAAPLQDVQRAMGMVRSRAKEWNVDPAKLGVIGFSAGGHLAATLSTNFETRTYDAVDDADKQSCRPDFAMLIYPFYLTSDADPAKLAPEIKVGEHTPPTFIVMTQDDRIEYAYAYALALKRAKVPAELHAYATGGHGFGMRKQAGAVSVWPKLAEEWMRKSGWVN